MGMTLKPIPFWVPEIELTEITEASRKADFEMQGKTIADFGYDRIGFSNLYEYEETGELLLKFRNGEFVRFFEASRDNRDAHATA